MLCGQNQMRRTTNEIAWWVVLLFCWGWGGETGRGADHRGLDDGAMGMQHDWCHEHRSHAYIVHFSSLARLGWGSAMVHIAAGVVQRSAVAVWELRAEGLEVTLNTPWVILNDPWSVPIPTKGIGPPRTILIPFVELTQRRQALPDQYLCTIGSPR